MLFQVVIARYNDFTNNPDAALEWQTTHRGVDQFRTLELIQEATRGVLAEFTSYDIADEAEAPVSESHVVSLAYATANRDPAYRARFARVVVDALAHFLFPWDDAVRLSPPPQTYWLEAACWVHRMLGEVEDWLAEHVDDAYGASLQRELVRHDSRIRGGNLPCWHRVPPLPATF